MSSCRSCWESQPQGDQGWGSRAALKALLKQTKTVGWGRGTGKLLAGLVFICSRAAYPAGQIGLCALPGTGSRALALSVPFLLPAASFLS